MSRCFEQHIAARTNMQLIDQIARRAKGRNAVDYYEEGMTPLLAYMFFVLHYHENYLTVHKLHQWPIIPHSAMRRYTDRVAWIRQYSVSMTRILKQDVEEVLQFLLTRFGPAEQPFLPVIPIGQREMVILARAVLASRIPYREIFQHDAKAFALPQEALHVWELPVSHMPGPEEQANRYYLWGHGTTAEGLTGILTLGRVLRSSLEAVGPVGFSQSDEVLSFYGTASQEAHYEPCKLEFVSKLHHSTKNSAGVVVGGFIGTAHHKSKSSSTVHEGHLCKFHALVHSPSGDKRWAIREAAGRIDRIWVPSSTHSAQIAMNTEAEVAAPRPVTFDGEMAMIGESIGPALKMLFVARPASPMSNASLIREDFSRLLHSETVVHQLHQQGLLRNKVVVQAPQFDPTDGGHCLCNNEQSYFCTFLCQATIE